MMKITPNITQKVSTALAKAEQTADLHKYLGPDAILPELPKIKNYETYKYFSPATAINEPVHTSPAAPTIDFIF